MTDDVLCQVEDGVAVVTMNRPQRRNALGGDMPLHLADVLEGLARNELVRVVVLTGAGKDFCVGADINAMAAGVPAPDVHYRRLLKIYRVPALLHDMPQITVAAIDGGCAGAGLGFACACDFRFTTARAVYSTAFMNVGVAGDMGTSWLLSRLTGPARARELMFFPEKFGGEEAVRLGIATRLFEADMLLTKTRALAAQLVARSPAALRGLKANFVSAESQSLADYLQTEAARHSLILTGSDAREAFKAAAEKRPPHFG